MTVLMGTHVISDETLQSKKSTKKWFKRKKRKRRDKLEAVLSCYLVLVP